MWSYQPENVHLLNEINVRLFLKMKLYKIAATEAVSIGETVK